MNPLNLNEQNIVRMSYFKRISDGNVILLVTKSNAGTMLFDYT